MLTDDKKQTIIVDDEKENPTNYSSVDQGDLNNIEPRHRYWHQQCRAEHRLSRPIYNILFLQEYTIHEMQRRRKYKRKKR